MRRFVTYPVLCSLLLGAGPWAALSAEHPEHPAATRPPLARQDTLLVTVTASVEAIDQAKREVTLKGPLGNKVTFVVDQRVKRLKEVKVGDLVTADYYVSIAAELRKPTAEEEKNPIVLLDAAGKAPAGSSPAAGGLRRFKVVTTVEGVDRPTQTVTIKGPRGNYLTLRAADPANLEQMRLGETIVVTYTEALAVSLEKAKKRNVE